VIYSSCGDDFIVTLVRVLAGGGELRFCRSCYFPSTTPAIGRTPPQRTGKAKARQGSHL
jgi:hypothetical protein